MRGVAPSADGWAGSELDWVIKSRSGKYDSTVPPVLPTQRIDFRSEESQIDAPFRNTIGPQQYVCHEVSIACKRQVRLVLGCQQAWPTR
jgi:hypothetical protein